MILQSTCRHSSTSIPSSIKISIRVLFPCISLNSSLNMILPMFIFIDWIAKSLDKGFYVNIGICMFIFLTYFLTSSKWNAPYCKLMLYYVSYLQVSMLNMETWSFLSLVLINNSPKHSPNNSLNNSSRNLKFF